MPAHYKNRYLNTFINKFRKRFKDNNLSVSDLHYLLNKFGINKNNDGTYDITILNALLNGYNVGPKYVNINTIIKYYDNFLKTTTPISNNVQSSVKTFYPKQKDNDDLYWADGENMEEADRILQQKYQYESKNIRFNKNNKMKQVIKLKESDLHRMIKESIRKILKENDEIDYDALDVQGDVCGFIWNVIIGDENTKSNEIFNTVDEAKEDCDRYLRRIKFNKIAKQYNFVNGEYEEDYAIALISSVNEKDEEIDTYLQNLGFGWMD